MSDRAPFPGQSADEGERVDRSEMWKEYMAIRAEADELGAQSLVRMGEGNPRDAGVLAMLSISSRLEALVYIISKAKVF